MEKHDRAFKGVWIPAKIWLDTRLTYFEKCLLAEIDSLDGKKHCYASNEYFAEFFNEGIRKIQRGIAKLRNLGYIEQVSFNGRTRYLKSTYDKFDTSNVSEKTSHDKFDTPPTTDLTPLQRQICHPYNKEDNKAYNSKEKEEKDASEEATYSLFIKKVHSIINKSRKERGLSEINPSFSKVSLAQAKNLLKLNTMEYFLELCEYAMQDDFWWQNLKSLRSLQKHYLTFEALKYKSQSMKNKKTDPEDNYKFARKIEQQWQYLNNPESIRISAYKEGFCLYKGQSQVDLPSYEMPHEEFKTKTAQMLEKFGLLKYLKK